MKLWKKFLIVLIVLAVLSIAVLGGWAFNKMRKQRNADDLYSQMQLIFADYPQLTDPYGYTSFYYCDGSAAYILLKNGDRQISAMRDAQGETVYFTDGKAWQLDENGVLVDIGISEEPVEEIAQTVIGELLSDPEVKYSYGVARGRDLPLWSFRNEPYLECFRAKNPECFELMTRESEDAQNQVYWYIGRSETDISFFVYLNNHLQDAPSFGQGSVPGWGEIPDGVWTVLFRAENSSF